MLATQGSMSRTVVSFVGRALVAYVFVGAAVWHLRSAGYEPTLDDMRAHGVPLAPVLLWVSMIMSAGAGVALLLGWHASLAASVLAIYTLIVSSVMHNPTHAEGMVLFLFIKDLGIAGALLAFAARPPHFASQEPIGR